MPNSINVNTNKENDGTPYNNLDREESKNHDKIITEENING